MKIKKILSVALTAVLIGSSSVLPVCAKTNAPDNTYSYVALGDSIAAGYGLGSSEESNSLDRALILSQELIDDPVKEAYVAVFGQYLEELGNEKGLDVKTTNLSSTAYRAEDIAKTILTDGYKGEVAEFILNTFVAEGTGEVLANYHGLYNKYLPEADLVSIQLGGNDIVMGFIYPMIKSDNVIFKAISTSMALVLFGLDTKTALGAGLMIIENNKESITYSDLAEVAKYFAYVSKNGEMYVENAAQNVSSVVDAVRTVNSGADIALIGMYNPYGNSLVCDDTTYNLSTVLTNIFTKAAEEIFGKDLGEADAELLPDSEIEEKAEDSEELLVEFSENSKKMDHLRNCSRKAAEKIKDNTAKLVSIVKDEISYPLQYLTAGKNVDPQMKSLNEKLKAIADEKELSYVDVYGISNENNLDPHPTAEGHREIAECMKNGLSDVVAAGMNAELSDDSLVNLSTVSAEKVQIGDDIRVEGAAEGGAGGYKYAFYFKRSVNSKWNKIGTEFGTKTYGTIVPQAAADYDMKVIVKDSAGNTAEKIFKVTVVESLPLTNVSYLSAYDVPVGKTVIAKGRFVGGTKPVTYEFYFKRSTNTKWNKISYGDESGTYAKFTPTAATSYDIKVVAIDSTGAKDSKIMTITAS